MKGSGYNCFNRSESDESGRLCLNSNIRKEFCVVDEFEHWLKMFTESDDCLSDALTPKSTKPVQKISSSSNKQNELKTKKTTRTTTTTTTITTTTVSNIFPDEDEDGKMSELPTG